MPCRNAFPYLPAAAESVLGQSDCFECPPAVGVRAMAVLGFLNPEQRVIKRVRAASRADAVFYRFVEQGLSACLLPVDWLASCRRPSFSKERSLESCKLFMLDSIA